MNFVELCQMWGGVEVGDAVLAWLCWSPWCGWEPIVFSWYPQVLSYPSSFSSELLTCAHVFGESLCVAHPEAQREALWWTPSLTFLSFEPLQDRQWLSRPVVSQKRGAASKAALQGLTSSTPLLGRRKPLFPLSPFLKCLWAELPPPVMSSLSSLPLSPDPLPGRTVWLMANCFLMADSV